MSKTHPDWLALVLCVGLAASFGPAGAEEAREGFESGDAEVGFERTPPRLSFTDGEVSFLRPGAEEWAAARVNTALASGDGLYVGEGGNLEVQIGGRAFMRAGEETDLGLTTLEPDYLQFRLTTGLMSLDLRSLEAGQTLEVDTPHAAFTIERTGYYRIEVGEETTTFTSRRGGLATLTAPSGEQLDIAASEQVVVTGTSAARIESYAAPELDAWDRWNYTRTDDQLDAVSARYVSADVYGLADLDHHGAWRIVPTYGAVWIPHRVAVDWVPYSTGRWVYDPYYGWTWLDDAPWGWAPFHYGRWVHVSGHWGWCPGPLVVRPYYSPALVAFYAGGGFSVSVTIGSPRIAWVALGWGEPLVPWWGPKHFREYGHWAGWAGPRRVNRERVKRTKVYFAKEINVYEHAHEREAIVQVERDRFGRYPEREVRYSRARAGEIAPLHGGLDVRPDPTSLVGGARSAVRPPRELRGRSVVAARPPRIDPAPRLEARGGSGPAPKGDAKRPARDAPPTRLAKPPQEGKPARKVKRAPYGRHGDVERSIPPPTPRFDGSAAPRKPPSSAGEVDPRPAERTRPAPPDSRQRVGPRSTTRPESGERRERVAPPQPPAPSATREERPPVRSLPGEPANRVYRAERRDRHGDAQRREQPAPRTSDQGGDAQGRRPNSRKR